MINHSSEASMFKHILLATDGSAASGNASALAVSLARQHGARLTALYVVDPYPYLGIGEANPLGFQAYMSAAQNAAAQAHAQVAALCEQGGAPVALQTRTVEDVTAAAGIVQTAQDEGADLIVVGTHGRTGVARLMLGSVASKVAAESPVPVLLAR
ncbi:universal stress protein [Variovorax terrae]|uniref:Universal stress protein n=1 Tax=Variovorax terrae TaxID=2923278 RepID=A0A9X1VW57_9BURK|nr:universal stress protein [Variovorax terrae]MCJ0762977.1 universal stress protein [Variovorax terrae]